MPKKELSKEELEHIFLKQGKRTRNCLSFLEQIVLKFIDSSEIVQRILTKHHIHVEYVENGQQRDIADYPAIEKYTEFAFAPHLLDICDVVAGMMALNKMKEKPAPLVAVKWETFAKYGNLANLIFEYIGAVPINRPYPLGDDPFSVKDKQLLNTVVKFPDLYLLFAIEGTRQTSGMPGAIQGGLGDLISNHLAKLSEGEGHMIICMATSIDVIAGDYYVTFCPPIYVKASDFTNLNIEDRRGEGNNSGNKKNKKIGNKISEMMFSAITSSMKVTYNHIAASVLIHYATTLKANKTDANKTENFEITQKDMALIANYVNAFNLLNVKGVNFHNMNSSLFSPFMEFCEKNGYIYREDGRVFANAKKLRQTFENYEADKYREYAESEKEKGKSVPDLEKLSYSRRGELTRGFMEDNPLQYMERMTRHLIREHEIRYHNN